MNKYQEALKKLYNDACGYEYQKSSIKEKELLQELVDRATPKKPNMENLNYICCPNCHSDEIELYDYHGTLVKLKHCNICGQPLDWSNYDE